MQRTNKRVKAANGLALIAIAGLTATNSLGANTIDTSRFARMLPQLADAAPVPGIPAATPISEALTGGVIIVAKGIYFQFAYDGQGYRCLAGGDARGSTGMNQPSRDAVAETKDGQCSSLPGFEFHGNLNRANFNHADLTSADLTKASLRDAHMREATLKGAKLTGADLTWVDARGRVPANPDLAADQADWSGADFEGAVLEHADFVGLNLAGAKFQGARAALIVLNNADLTGARFEGADLSEAQLRAADLTNVTYDGSTKWAGAVYNDRTKLPFGLEEAKKLGMVSAEDEAALYSPVIERMHTDKP